VEQKLDGSYLHVALFGEHQNRGAKILVSVQLNPGEVLLLAVGPLLALAVGVKE
jgi:hypothetical protein